MLRNLHEIVRIGYMRERLEIPKMGKNYVLECESDLDVEEYLGESDDQNKKKEVGDEKKITKNDGRKLKEIEKVGENIYYNDYLEDILPNNKHKEEGDIVLSTLIRIFDYAYSLRNENFRTDDFMYVGQLWVISMSALSIGYLFSSFLTPSPFSLSLSSSIYSPFIRPKATIPDLLLPFAFRLKKIIEDLESEVQPGDEGNDGGDGEGKSACSVCVADLKNTLAMLDGKPRFLFEDFKKLDEVHDGSENDGYYYDPLEWDTEDMNFHIDETDPEQFLRGVNGWMEFEKKLLRRAEESE